MPKKRFLRLGALAAALLVSLLLALASCGDGGPEDSSNWDEMIWDEDAWA